MDVGGKQCLRSLALASQRCQEGLYDTPVELASGAPSKLGLPV